MIILYAIICVSLLHCATVYGKDVVFNTSSCSNGCNFMDPTIWVGGQAPTNGDAVNITGRRDGAMVNMTLSASSVLILSLFTSDINLTLINDANIITNQSMIISSSSIYINNANLVVLGTQATPYAELKIDSNSTVTISSDGSLGSFIARGFTSYPINFTLSQSSSLVMLQNSTFQSTFAGGVFDGTVQAHKDSYFSVKSTENVKFAPFSFHMGCRAYVDNVKIPTNINITFEGGLSCKKLIMEDGAALDVTNGLDISGRCSLAPSNVIRLQGGRNYILNTTEFGTATLILDHGSLSISDVRSQPFLGRMLLLGAVNVSFGWFDVDMSQITFDVGRDGSAPDVLFTCESNAFVTLRSSSGSQVIPGRFIAQNSGSYILMGYFSFSGYIAVQGALVAMLPYDATHLNSSLTTSAEIVLSWYANSYFACDSNSPNDTSGRCTVSAKSFKLGHDCILIVQPNSFLLIEADFITETDSHIRIGASQHVQSSTLFIDGGLKLASVQIVVFTLSPGSNAPIYVNGDLVLNGYVIMDDNVTDSFKIVKAYGQISGDFEGISSNHLGCYHSTISGYDVFLTYDSSSPACSSASSSSSSSSSSGHSSNDSTKRPIYEYIVILGIVIAVVGVVLVGVMLFMQKRRKRRMEMSHEPLLGRQNYTPYVRT